MIKTMIWDERPIKFIGQGEDVYYPVGGKIDGRVIARFEVYGEPSQGAFTPWIAALSEDGTVLARFNAALFDTVVYQ